MNDIGPRPHAFDIEEATAGNETYRTVAWTGRYLQVSLMTIRVGESIGLERHPATPAISEQAMGLGGVPDVSGC